MWTTVNHFIAKNEIVNYQKFKNQSQKWLDIFWLGCIYQLKIGHTVCNIEYVVSYIYTQVSECCINKQFKLMEVLFKAQDSICEFY